MHTIEKKESNVFKEGMDGWKMLFNAVRRKKKPQQQQVQQQGDGYSMSNS